MSCIINTAFIYQLGFSISSNEMSFILNYHQWIMILANKAFWNNIFYLMLRLLVDLDFIIIHGRRFAALKGFWLHLTYNYHDTQIAHIHSSVSSAQMGILHDKRLIATRNKTWNFIGGLSFFLKRFYISHGKSNSLNVK